MDFEIVGKIREIEQLRLASAFEIGNAFGRCTVKGVGEN